MKRMFPFRGRRRSVCVVAAAFSVLPVLWSQQGRRAEPRTGSRMGPMSTVAEQYLLGSINAERAAAGLPAVHFTEALQRAAHAHALQMARANQLSHRLQGEADLFARGQAEGARFFRITENVAWGASILGMHTALMESPHHRENILDRYVDAVGVSVVQWNGTLWAVEDFTEAMSVASRR